MGNAVGVLPPSKQCVDENEESDNKIGKPMNMNEEEAREDTSSNRRIVPQQPPKAHAARPLRGKIVGEKRIINAHPMRKCLADESNPSVLKEEARVDSSSRQQIDLEQLPEFQVHTAKQLRGKRVAGVKRIRDAHSMRKSLAEAGTTFETGVRRSKRIRMRPLEYWKGERFVYGRVDNSMELIGVKYLSPGKGNDNLKVKPFISLETPRIQGAS